MKTRRTAIFCSIILCNIIAFLIPRIASAQGSPQGCYGSLQQVSCSTPGTSCSGSITTATPTTYGTSYAWNQRSCCGEQFWVPMEWLGTCYSAELRTPEIRKHLFERGQKSELLVASCDGYLRQLPHVVFTETPVPPKRWSADLSTLGPTFTESK
jgi:hypothetical protein